MHERSLGSRDFAKALRSRSHYDILQYHHPSRRLQMRVNSSAAAEVPAVLTHCSSSCIVQSSCLAREIVRFVPLEARNVPASCTVRIPHSSPVVLPRMNHELALALCCCCFSRAHHDACASVCACHAYGILHDLSPPTQESGHRRPDVKSRLRLVRKFRIIVYTFVRYLLGPKHSRREASLPEAALRTYIRRMLTSYCAHCRLLDSSRRDIFTATQE